MSPNSFEEPYTPLLLGDVLASQVKYNGGVTVSSFFIDFYGLVGFTAGRLQD